MYRQRLDDRTFRPVTHYEPIHIILRSAGGSHDHHNSLYLIARSFNSTTIAHELAVQHRFVDVHFVERLQAVCTISLEVETLVDPWLGLVQ